MFQENNEIRMGSGAFCWFTGIVEDVNDPLTLGRVRVRVFGDHTQNKTSTRIPTESLPWALFMNSATEASMSGIGKSPTGILKGSTVVGFYVDGMNKQMPMIMGTIGGIPENAADGSLGFNDPDGVFPLAALLGEPDTNRLARGKAGYKGQDHPVFTKRKADNIADNTTATGSWDEPAITNDSVYPFNSVSEYYYTSGWGHIEEWDSTPGKERYLRWCKSGSFLESHTDGSEVHKIVGDNFELDLKNKHLLVKQDYKVTIEGSRDEHTGKNSDIHIVGNAVYNVDGDSTWNIGGNLTVDVSGNIKTTAGGNIQQNSSGTTDIISAANMGLQAPVINADTSKLNVTGIVKTAFCDCLSKTAIISQIDRT